MLSKLVSVAAVYILLVLGIVAPGRAAEPDLSIIIAVFDVDDATGDLAPEILDQLTDYLATRLGEGGRFRIIPRADIRERLYDSKRESYRTCYDEECQIELGRDLAASKTLSAKILRLGQGCNLALQMYDLRRAVTEATANARVSCEVENLMEAIDRAVDYLKGSSGLSTSCSAGKVLMAGHCCWPGQDWGANSNQCIGEPRCPDGSQWFGNECRPLNAEEQREHCIKEQQLPCLRRCSREPPEPSFVQDCIQDKLDLCLKNGQRDLHCRADLEGCTSWCQRNANSKQYCAASCRDSFEREAEQCLASYRRSCESECPSCPEEPAK